MPRMGRWSVPSLRSGSVGSEAPADLRTIACNHQSHESARREAGLCCRRARAQGQRAHLLRPGLKCGHLSFAFVACLHGRLRCWSCNGHGLSLIAPTRCRCCFGENFLASLQWVRNPPMHGRTPAHGRERARKGDRDGYGGDVLRYRRRRHLGRARERPRRRQARANGLGNLHGPPAGELGDKFTRTRERGEVFFWRRHSPSSCVLFPEFETWELGGTECQPATKKVAIPRVGGKRTRGMSQGNFGTRGMCTNSGNARIEVGERAGRLWNSGISIRLP